MRPIPDSIPRRLALLAAIALCLPTACGAPRDAHPKAPVHPSPIAGSWYPADAQALRAMLKTFFDAAMPLESSDDLGPVVAVIAPHAGYAYCGQTAASAYATLARRQPCIRRVLILGPSHRVPFRGASIGDYSAYRTPLGDAPMDLQACATLRRCPLVRTVETVHQVEHSVDIQVPLIQYAFGKDLPQIVPVVIGQLEPQDYPVLAEALRTVLDPYTAIAVSSDFTHYGPRYGYQPFPPSKTIADDLRRLNDQAIQAIETGDPQAFLQYARKTQDTICGLCPIALLLQTLPPDTQPHRRHYSTSADTSRDYTNVVVYRAMAFTSQKGWQPPAGQPHARAAPQVDEAERAALLDLARRSLIAASTGASPPDAPRCRKMPRLCEKRAAFVTLNTPRGQLRGCIGSIFPQEPLWESVRRHARNAAINDRRFPPVAAEEAARLHIEISVLNLPQPVDSWRSIHIGRDGILLTQDDRGAVYLPHVAPQQGWTLEETLTHLSQKAGLAPNAWKDPNCQFQTFQATVFAETHPTPEAPHE